MIFPVVDLLSKNAYFIALANPYTAAEVAQAYLDNFFKHHGCPRSIVTDREALFTLQGIDLLLSSTNHPQTDGQTKVLNRCLEICLRRLTSDKPKEWSKWLPVEQGGIILLIIQPLRSLFMKSFINWLLECTFPTWQEKLTMLLSINHHKEWKQ